jgi:hypothetical protein
MARTVPFSIGNVYVLPVRLSVIVKVCSDMIVFLSMN